MVKVKNLERRGDYPGNLSSTVKVRRYNLKKTKKSEKERNLLKNLTVKLSPQNVKCRCFKNGEFHFPILQGNNAYL